MKSIALIAVSSAVLLAPVLAFAQYTGGPYTQTVNTNYSVGYVSTPGGFALGGTCSGSGITCIASTILYLINAVLVPVLFAVAFLVFLYGIAKAYIFSNGEPSEVEKGHKLILWGVIGFVVMVSLWGLVNVVANTFGLGGAGAPPLPSSVSSYSTGGGAMFAPQY
ncbi:MAG: hypothetical protein ACYC48_01025 [Minisyncoccota bacterium]